jgi:FkbH-like protein
MSVQKNNISILEFFKQYKQICTKKKSFFSKKLKITLLSSFTTKGIKEVLTVKCSNLNIYVEFYECEYKQYTQEILNPQSNLYSFDPSLILLFIDTKTILGENFFFPYNSNAINRKTFVKTKENEIYNLVNILTQNTSATILLHNLEIPSYSPLGILENKQEFGFAESIENLNNNIRNTFKKNNRVLVFDYNAFCSYIGKSKITNEKLYYLGDIKIDFEHILPLCDAYLAYIKPLVSISKKCIVLDLDNTLWGGIIGEDGIEGIKLGPTPEGSPFWEFQKHLLALFNRGIILAVNSKNNSQDALKAIKKHPYMVLKEKHFASIQINWNDKISNIETIAKEINIGIDSMVFFDDDPLNREMVRESLPGVLVPELPQDASFYSKTLHQINDFNTLQLTEEDKKRGSIYAAQRKRSEFKSSARNLTNYLQSLNIKITIEKPNQFNIPRIAQLTQKTNQFNVTTKRYSQLEIENMSKSQNKIIVAIKVEDKFGDNGLTGVAIIEKNQNHWDIDSFLLSCRIIGRKVENSLLAYIIKQAKTSGVKKITGTFIPTQKNLPAKNFFEENGFMLDKKNNLGIEKYSYILEKEYFTPNFIKTIELQGE